MHQVIYYVRNETILNRMALNQHQIDTKTYLQIKRAKHVEKTNIESYSHYYYIDKNSNGDDAQAYNEKKISRRTIV